MSIQASTLYKERATPGRKKIFYSQHIDNYYKFSFVRLFRRVRPGWVEKQGDKFSVGLY